VLDGQGAEVEAILGAAATLPVMASRRLVAVRRAQALPARAAPAFTRYAAAPSPTGCLLLLADEPLSAGRERKGAHWLLSAVPAAWVVAVAPRNARAAADWVRQRAGREGLEVSEEAARLLVQFVGEDAATLLGEVRKAALLGGPDNRTVGAREVRAVVGEHRISGIFELTRAIEEHDAGAALRALDRLLLTEEAPRLVWLLAREVRTRWSVREWREQGQSVDQIARMLRRPPAVLGALVAGATAEPAAGHARKLERCWQVEHRLKSSGEPRAELTALVVELCRPGG
jgi:DNA polymerase-3 subunit delta